MTSHKSGFPLSGKSWNDLESCKMSCKSLEINELQETYVYWNLEWWLLFHFFEIWNTQSLKFEIPSTFLGKMFWKLTQKYSGKSWKWPQRFEGEPCKSLKMKKVKRNADVSILADPPLSSFVSIGRTPPPFLCCCHICTAPKRKSVGRHFNQAVDEEQTCIVHYARGYPLSA